MSIPKKYKIGDKINDWEIVDLLINQKCPYICKCKCGAILQKNTGALNKNKCCKNCQSNYKRKLSFRIKFKIGERIGSFEIISYNQEKNTLRYVCKCDCGQIEFKYCTLLNKESTCKACSKPRSSIHIGKTINNFTVIDSIKVGARSKVKVVCNICKNEQVKSFTTLRNNSFCSNCTRGYYPNKVIDGMTLIKRIGNARWMIKCECDTLFESNLRKYNGKISSCGCRKRVEALKKAKNKIGLKYRFLKVNKIMGFDEKHLILELKCICGNKIYRRNGNEFKSESCGCKWRINAPKGENHSFSILKDIEVVSLRDLYASGCYSKDELAKIFSISVKYVSMLLQEKRRASI